MTRNDCPELMGAAEIGRLLGVSRQRVQQLTQATGFPEPVQHLDMGKVWLADDIRDWARKRETALGRSNRSTGEGEASNA